MEEDAKKTKNKLEVAEVFEGDDPPKLKTKFEEEGVAMDLTE
jgi:hypothetical protein